MKIKLKSLYPVRAALNALGELHLPVWYAVAKTRNKVDAVIQEYERLRELEVQKYARYDSDGKPLRNVVSTISGERVREYRDGMTLAANQAIVYDIPEEDAHTIEKWAADALGEMVEVDIHTFGMDRVADISLPPLAAAILLEHGIMIDESTDATDKH